MEYKWWQVNARWFKWRQVHASEYKWWQVNQVNTRGFKWMQWMQVHTSEGKWIQEDASEFKWIQVMTSECKRMKVNASVCKWMQGNTRVCNGMQENAKWIFGFWFHLSESSRVSRNISPWWLKDPHQHEQKSIPSSTVMTGVREYLCSDVQDSNPTFIMFNSVNHDQWSVFTTHYNQWLTVSTNWGQSAAVQPSPPVHTSPHQSTLTASVVTDQLVSIKLRSMKRNFWSCQFCPSVPKQHW